MPAAVSTSSQAARGSPSRGCPTEPGLRRKRWSVELDGDAAGREPAVDLVAVQRERERDVRVADEHERLGRRLEREQRHLLAEHVLPHRVAWAGVEQLGAVAPRERRERAEPGPLLVSEDAGRPPRGRRRVAAELGDVEQPERREVVVAAEGDRGALANEVAAFVRPRPVPDDVAEAPDLVDRLSVDVGEHRFQCVKIGVDVRDDCDAHGEGRHASWGGCRLVRRSVAAVAHERPVAAPVRPRRRAGYFSAHELAALVTTIAASRASTSRTSSRRSRRSSSSSGCCRAASARWGSAGSGARSSPGWCCSSRSWFVGLPFSLVDLWWQHHWGLGPVRRVRVACCAVVDARAGGDLRDGHDRRCSSGCAGRFRRWWLIASPIVVVFAAFFAFVSGLDRRGRSHPLDDPALAADVTRLERIEHVQGTPVRVEDVSSWTDQANAFTVGFGPSTHVVLWDTILDERFSRAEQDVVIAHELGHVRSRHIMKAIGWSALIVLPTLWLLALATRRRGGVGDPANLPYVFLVLTVLALLTAPIENAVSRRYEAEADWRALNATRDPPRTRQLFQEFGRTSLEEPNPPLLDYLWLENHPTLAQRIAMAQAWQAKKR